MSPPPSGDRPVNTTSEFAGPTESPDTGVVPSLSWRWIAAFSVLALVLHELHELAHTWSGRILCGSWGSRDFNTWSLAEGCSAWFPLAAGPAFTYGTMWAGAGLVLLSRRRSHGLAGLALVFAAGPAARIFTVALGGGDELMLASRLVDEAGVGLWLVTATVVLLICIPPLIVGWRALCAARHPVLWFIGLFLGQFVLVIVFVLIVLNTLLRQGLLAEPVVLGEPLFVASTTVALVVLLAFTGRWLVAPAGSGSGPAARSYTKP